VAQPLGLAGHRAGAGWLAGEEGGAPESSTSCTLRFQKTQERGESV